MISFFHQLDKISGSSRLQVVKNPAERPTHMMAMIGGQHVKIIPEDPQKSFDETVAKRVCEVYARMLDDIENPNSKEQNALDFSGYSCIPIYKRSKISLEDVMNTQPPVKPKINSEPIAYLRPPIGFKNDKKMNKENAYTQ